jgi:hypothetical protein
MLVALGVVAGAVHYRDATASRSAGASADPRRLVPVSIADVGAVEIADDGTLHRFERDAKGTWFYHGAHGATTDAHVHDADLAVASRIERAFEAFGRTRIERELPRGRDLAAYGLLAPRMLVLVYRRHDRQPILQYAFGDVAPDTVSRYVDVVGGAGIVTIPGYHVDNLKALLEAVTARQ